MFKSIEFIKTALVEKIIANLNEFNAIWNPNYLPIKSFNFKTNKAYMGCNQILLSIWGSQYKDPRWLTFNQAKSLDLKIKKSAKPISLIYYGQQKPDLSESKVIKVFDVFNALQIENMPPLENTQIKMTKKLLNVFIDKILDISPVKIVLSLIDKTPCYKPLQKNVVNQINLPLKTKTESSGAMLSLLIHELSHASKWQNQNNQINENPWYSEKDYAFEELVVALTQMYVFQEYNIKPIGFDHKPYSKYWIELLKNDGEMLFLAVNKAAIAFNWLKQNILVQAQNVIYERNKQDNE
ncbi:MAG: DUF1738 domain-containing protein [Malacoplasma sp.]|nr:DUF1738 domain-containing protein [Malacoplasma sp.]